MASLRVLKMSDMGSMLSAVDEASKEELYRTIQAQNWLMSNMGLQIIDAAEDMQSHQYTFGGIADVNKQFMMDISGAARIPATKLFGRSPEGMNATGESDLQNYYDMIAQEQESKLRPILNKLLPVLCMDVFGAVPDDLDFEFDPVSEPSDQERSDLAKSGTENVVTALNVGLVSPRTALKELKQQSERTGVWTNITDADIFKASDEVQGEGKLGGFGDMDSMGGGEGQTAGHAGPQRPPQDPGDKPPEDPGKPQEMPKFTKDSDWEESRHPRDDDGRFTSSGSNGKMYSGLEISLKKSGLIKPGHIVEAPKPIIVTSLTEHAKRHGVTKKMAQHYVDHAFVRIKQTPDKYEYLADDGTVIAITPAGRVVSAWSKKDYDERHAALVREVRKWITGN